MKRDDAIVIIFDDLYFEYAKACINSIKKNFPGHPIILIFYDGFDEGIIRCFDNLSGVRLTFLSDDFFNSMGLNLAELNWGLVNNKKVYYKYLLWTNLFADHNNLLYLDADTIVLKPLDYLFQKNEFYAVTDFSNSPGYKLFHPKFEADINLLSLLKEDNIVFPNKGSDMINAGVFMIPARFRNEKYSEDLLRITFRYNEFTMFADQSAISLWCHHNKIIIHRDLRYNFQINFYNKDITDFNYDDIHIIHFSWCKPGTVTFISILMKSYHFINMYHSFLSLQKF